MQRESPWIAKGDTLGRNLTKLQSYLKSGWQIVKMLFTENQSSCT